MDTTQFFNLAPWGVLIPLIGLVINLLVNGRWGEKFAGILASLATGLSLVISILLAVALGSHPQAVTVSLGNWITIDSLSVDWGFRVLDHD